MPIPATTANRPPTILGKEAKIPTRNSLPPRRQPNATTRTREHLLPDEVNRVLKARGATSGAERGLWTVCAHQA